MSWRLQLWMNFSPADVTCILFFSFREAASGRSKTNRPVRRAGASRSFGMTLTDTPPLTVIDVLARGPAQRAGLRRGQAVLAINGQPTAHLRRPQAMARLDWQPGAVNILTVAAQGGHTMDLELQSELVPMPHTQLLPGPVGLLRMD